MMVHLRVLVSLSLLLLLTGCPEEIYPVRVPIGFLIDATIKPSSHTIQRGDTLWLEVNFSDSLMDRHSGKHYRVRPQDLRLSSIIGFEQLQGVGQLPVGIAPTFRLVEKVGTAQIQGTVTGNFKPVYDGRSYRARIGLIPTKACVTTIALLPLLRNAHTDEEAMNDFLPFIQLPRNAEGQEQRAVLDYSYFVVNEGKANNYDLFSQHAKTFALAPEASPETVIYETKSRFTVEVK